MSAIDASCLPFRGWLLVAALVALVASGIAPYDRRDWVLEHVPTAALLAFLVWYENRHGGAPLGNASYALLFVFTLLHMIGAHHLYSRVPYEAWAQEWFGVSMSGALGTTRNHYDRIVHFSFGLLVLLPLAEIVHRHICPSQLWTIAVAIAFLGVMSKVYELCEWAVAIALSPDAAEAYNGQQGDPFDAQKDMALALAGSFVACPFVALRFRLRPARETRGQASAPQAPDAGA